MNHDIDVPALLEVESRQRSKTPAAEACELPCSKAKEEEKKKTVRHTGHCIASGRFPVPPGLSSVLFRVSMVSLSLFPFLFSVSFFRSRSRVISI